MITEAFSDLVAPAERSRFMLPPLVTPINDFNKICTATMKVIMSCPNDRELAHNIYYCMKLSLPYGLDLR